MPLKNLLWCCAYSSVVNHLSNILVWTQAQQNKQEESKEEGRKKETDSPVQLDMDMHTCNPGIQEVRQEDSRVEAEEAKRLSQKHRLPLLYSLHPGTGAGRTCQPHHCSLLFLLFAFGAEAQTHGFVHDHKKCSSTEPHSALGCFLTTQCHMQL